jgi:hypothetical protein
MFCLSHRNKVYFIFEKVIQLSYNVLPTRQLNSCELTDVEFLEIVFFLEAGRENRIARNIFNRIVVFVSFFFILFLAFHLQIEQNFHDFEGSTFSQINEILTQLQDEAAIRDDFLGSFEVGVKVALPSYVRTAIIVALMKDSWIAIDLTSFPFELNNIVFVVDGMHIDIGASRGWTVVDAVIEDQGHILASWTFPAIHDEVYEIYN